MKDSYYSNSSEQKSICLEEICTSAEITSEQSSKTENPAEKFYGIYSSIKNKISKKFQNIKEDISSRIQNYIDNKFYFKESVGKNGEIIQVCKLKTLDDEADEYHNESLKNGFDENGKLDQSRYILPGKAWLRISGIDELPQIPYNIFLKRNMKLVGPRPVKKETYNTYPKRVKEKRIKIRPGFMGASKSSWGNTDIEKNEIYLDRHKKILS